MSESIFNIIIGIPCDEVSVFILEGEFTVAEDVECSPGTGFTASHSAEIQRSISVTEAEFLVFAAEISHFAGK